jgi:hypothetical protein
LHKTPTHKQIPYCSTEVKIKTNFTFFPFLLLNNKKTRKLQFTFLKNRHFISFDY